MQQSEEEFLNWGRIMQRACTNFSNMLTSKNNYLNSLYLQKYPIKLVNEEKTHERVYLMTATAFLAFGPASPNNNKDRVVEKLS